MKNENQTSNPHEEDSGQQGTIALRPDPKPTGLPPSEEQKRYWAQELFYKRLGLLISIGGFILIILSVFATRWQISINTEQLRLNTAQSQQVAKSIRANVESTIVTHVTSLDQVFMKEPDLAPYFYENKPIDRKDKMYPKVSATAVMVLDVFDLVATQNKHYPEFWDTPEAWDEWMIDVFSKSPILREFIDTHQGWYGKSLKALREKAKER
jgi:hypothetical protein